MTDDASNQQDRRVGYVGELGAKMPCRVATMVNIDLEGLQTVNGVALAENDPVLVNAQDDETENGPYIASTSEWNRAVWFNNQLSAVPGTLIVTVEGTENHDAIWETICDDNPIDFGTSEITFELKVKGTNTGDRSVALTGPVTGTSTESTPGVLTVATTITNDAITTSKILNANVTTAKIADSNITTVKIADSNVTTAKIADDAVTTVKIPDSNITTAKINDSAVTTVKINDNGVTNAKLVQVATATFKGRTTAGTGNSEDLTATQATALLNVMVGDSGSGGTKGLVPAPATGDATRFLTGAGTYASQSAVPAASETTPGIAELATQAETNAITDDTRIVTPLKLGSGFAMSLNASGYIKLPSWLGGFMMQWDTITGMVGHTNTTVSLPATFPTAALIAFPVGVSLASGNDKYPPMLVSISTTQIVVRNTDGANGLSCNYLIFGK